MPAAFPRLILAILLSLAAVATAKEFAPRNIIVMVADGWGFHHLDALNLWESGGEAQQAYESWPVRLAMSTYQAGGSYDPEKTWSEFRHAGKAYTDSAAAGTAMACGVKTYNGAIGLNSQREAVENVVERADALSKATGVISSAPISHATPAAFCVHTPNRNTYSEIAQKMFYASPLDVLMGGGHPWYNDSGKRLEQPNFKYVGGEATWNALVEGTLDMKSPWSLIETPGQVQELMTGDTPTRVVFVAQVHRTLQQKRPSMDDRKLTAPGDDPLIDSVPTLTEMTRAAINVLDEDPDGFFLMVEGGAVDWAGHDNQLGRMIEEMADFNAAVRAVEAWVESSSSWEETLVIVTSDHETGHLAGPIPTGQLETWLPLENRGKGSLPGAVWYSGSHTNTLVPFFARGEGARGFAQDHQVGTDPRRGPYIDNTAIARQIFALWPRPTDD